MAEKKYEEMEMVVPGHETFSTLTGRMERSGHDMYRCTCGMLRYAKESPGQAWQHEVSHHGACGYCKCDPCQCGGHGWR
jgi:hypothetical protein